MITTPLMERFGLNIAVDGIAELRKYQHTLTDLIYRHKVLRIRGLPNLTIEECHEVNSMFGTPWIDTEYKRTREAWVKLDNGHFITDYSNIESKKIGNYRLTYHSDMPLYRSLRFPMRSLYPVHLMKNRSGVNTWVDCSVIFERLSKAELDELMQVEILLHSWYAPGTKHRWIKLVDTHPQRGTPELLLNCFYNPDLAHPLPYQSPFKGAWIVDVRIGDRKLGAAYLNRLHELVITPDNTFVQEWEYGDFIIFDNMGVIHDRTPITVTDASDAERRFWRANVKHAWQTGNNAVMNDITLHYDRTLAFCPAYTFIMVHYAQMLVDKQTYPRLEFNNTSHVVYALDEDLNKVVGATVFYMLDDLSGHTCHTSVDAAYRGRGIASKMFAMVEDILRKKGAKSISTGAWIDNGEMKRVLEKTGRKVVVERGTKLLGPQYD